MSAGGPGWSGGAKFARRGFAHCRLQARLSYAADESGGGFPEEELSMQKRKRQTLIVLVLAALGLVFLFPGCSTTMHHQTIPDDLYQAAYERTRPAEGVTAPPGSEAEQRGIEGVKAMFQNYNAEYLATHIPQVYAENVYFRDAFKYFDSAAAIQAYMLEGLHAVRSCTFTFEDVIARDGEVYFRWTMVVSLNRDKPGEETRTMGMSHMRFNPEGKVIFHQDYWDPTDLLYVRIPVANWLIAKVKARL